MIHRLASVVHIRESYSVLHWEEESNLVLRQAEAPEAFQGLEIESD
jgi:hypothetical protein